MSVIAEQQQAPYLQVEGQIPIALDNGAFISIKRKPPLKIHLLGFQPAKSIPEIAQWFLQKYAPLPFTVLEPFAGSGTTIVESLRYGAAVYWLDYHPLSRLICQVKTSRFSPDEVSDEISKIMRSAINQQTAPETIMFANKDFWFQKPVQEGLEILRENILKSKPTIQPLFWLAFASTVRKTSDMNDGMILAARRPNVQEIPKRSRLDVFNYFRHYVEKTLEAVIEWNYLFEGSLWSSLNGSLANATELPSQDARNLPGEWQCDAIITSPPYINAIDYVWAAKFELHWLGLVQNDEDRLELYSKEIGTERIPKDEYRELGRTGNQHLDQLIEDIYLGRKYKATSGQNVLRARVVYKYFLDMKEHFLSSFARLRPSGYYCFSIGDVSKICGVDIPVASILGELACEAGFCEQFHFHILLKNRKLNIPRNVEWAGTIKHDTTIVLEKPV